MKALQVLFDVIFAKLETGTVRKWKHDYLTSQIHVCVCLFNLVLPLAGAALDPQHQLLGRFGLPPQDGLGLASEASLLAVVAPPSLGLLALSRLLVLSHLEKKASN